MAVSRPTPSLNALPDEVIHQIFTHLDVSGLLAISHTTRHLASVSLETNLWKQLILTDFKYWDRSTALHDKLADPSFTEWRSLYAVRYTADLATRAVVRRMLSSPRGRLLTANSALNHGYGIKDTLLDLHENPPMECDLAQKFWSRTLIQCINRSKALETWHEIKFRTDVKNPIELALSALDMFMIGAQREGDVEDTFRRLDGYVIALRKQHPDIESYTPRQKAITTAEFLREKKWVGIGEGREYYSMENQFLGYSLRSEHRDSLPLITCVIYCYVVRQLGLEAEPCAYPEHVCAVVRPCKLDKAEICDLDGVEVSLEQLQMHSAFVGHNSIISERTHLYMDPFNSSQPIFINDLAVRLPFFDPSADPSRRAGYMSPASPQQCLVRAAKNIINSISSNAHRRRPSDLSAYDAAYAALCALVLFPSSAAALASTLNDLQHHFVNHYADDLRNYEHYLHPSHSEVMGTQVDPLVRVIREEDNKPRVPKLRSGTVTEIVGGEREMVKYTVGTVFRHRRQGYRAVIYGWDGKCEMAERWIVGNGVDRLPRGRNQPFYNVYVEDTTTRYVAQENVEPLGPEKFTAEEAEKAFGLAVGRWFLRFDADTARYVSNVQDEYPED